MPATRGLAKALELRSTQATTRAAAEGKNVGIFGANVARQCIDHGLLDEIVVHLVVDHLRRVHQVDSGIPPPGENAVQQFTQLMQVAEALRHTTWRGRVGVPRIS